MQRFFTYVATRNVLMNSGYLFGKECDNEDFIVNLAKSFSIEKTSTVNATEVTRERLHPRNLIQLV